LCVAACPAGAIQLPGYEPSTLDGQLVAL